MRVRPTKSGGRSVKIDCPHLLLDCVVDPDGCISVNAAEVREPSRGLGDTIKKAADALGIKQCPKCKKRQRQLNELVPYKDQTNGD